MGEIIQFRKPRQGTIRGAARALATSAMQGVQKPTAIVVVALGENGDYAIRMGSYGLFRDFDVYSRGAAVLEKTKMDLLDG